MSAVITQEQVMSYMFLFAGINWLTVDELFVFPLIINYDCIYFFHSMQKKLTCLSVWGVFQPSWWQLLWLDINSLRWHHCVVGSLMSGWCRWDLRFSRIVYLCTRVFSNTPSRKIMRRSSSSSPSSILNRWLKTLHLPDSSKETLMYSVRNETDKT